jgi:transcriptional regulator with XRE-family HTH domain
MATPKPNSPTDETVLKKRQELSLAMQRRRKEQNWSQLSIAAKAGMSDANYGNIERGVQSPTYDQLIKIADALELPLCELLNLTPVNTVHNPIPSIIGFNSPVLNTPFNTEHARQTERYFELLHTQNQTLEKLVNVLAKP